MLLTVDLLLHLISPPLCFIYHRLGNCSHFGYVVGEGSFSHASNKLVSKRYCLLVLATAHLHQFHERISFEATSNLGIVGTEEAHALSVLD